MPELKLVHLQSQDMRNAVLNIPVFEDAQTVLDAYDSNFPDEWVR